MNRGNFFKALATVILAPSILKDINWSGQECLFSPERLEGRLETQERYNLKIKDIVDRKPPKGYSIGYDKLRKARWEYNYRWSMGKKVSVFTKYINA